MYNIPIFGGPIMRDTIIVREAAASDAARLVEIYQHYVKNTVVTYEYEVPSVEEFRQRIEKTLEKYPYLVAIVGDKIVGYAYAGTYIGRAACDWSVEVSIYVDVNYKGCGIGSRLYGELESILKEMHILNLNAAIASPEEDDEYLTKDSINFHKHMGYTVVGEFHNCGYKFGRWYKLMWMEKMLGDHAKYPKPVITYSDYKDICNI
jgi:phosphinothricin acetyltransferase